MNIASPADAAARVVDALVQINAEALDFEQASSRLDETRRDLPGWRVDLTFDTEPYDRSTHYTAILRDRSGVTLTVSAAAAGEPLLWPLRGARRVGDDAVVSVNGEVLSVGDVISWLDVCYDGADLAGTIVDACLLRQELRRRSIDVTPADEQEALDGFRRAKGLYTRAATEAWLRARGASEGSLRSRARSIAEHRVLRRQLADELGSDEESAVEQFLHARRDTAVITWCWALPGSHNGSAVL